MPDSDAQRTDPISVGSRVTVIPTFESQSGDTEPQVGVVVEDYADTVIYHSEMGAGLGAGAAVGDSPRRRPSGFRRRRRHRTRLNLSSLSPRKNHEI